jgi:hypothetical protein
MLASLCAFYEDTVDVTDFEHFPANRPSRQELMKENPDVNQIIRLFTTCIHHLPAHHACRSES